MLGIPETLIRTDDDQETCTVEMGPKRRRPGLPLELEFTVINALRLSWAKYQASLPYTKVIFALSIASQIVVKDLILAYHIGRLSGQ